ncbi:MAG: type IV secretory system conjugative DNA transfer family protein [Dyella sp.]
MITGVSPSASAGSDVAPPSLNDVLKLKTPNLDNVADMRVKMIAAAGHTVGFRAGLAHRGLDFKRLLDGRAEALDTMFQFQTLLGPGGVLPPVIVEARDSEAVDPDQVRSATRIFKIARAERLVSVPPTWRDYLYTGLIVSASIDMPQDDARPKGDAEMKAWQDSVMQGWNEGQAQAQAIFEANLNRLTRDFNGMLRYSILLKQSIITPTQVAESHRAVSGDTLEIKMDDRLRRITQRAELQIDASKWRLGGDAKQADKSASKTP